MFKVIIRKTIRAEKGVTDLAEHPNHASLEYILELPFAPYPGLSIGDRTEDSILYPGKIEDVMWDNHGKIFYCFTKDEKPYSDEDYYCCSFEELVKRALRDGWVKMSD